MVLVRVVDDGALEVLGEDVAHDAHREVGLLEDERRRARLRDARLEHLVELEEVQQLALEVVARRAVRGGAHDRAAAAQLEPLASPCAGARAPCRRGDARRRSPSPVGRVDHVATGDRQLHREARALGLERVLDDLHDDLLPGLEQRADVLVVSPPPRPRRGASTPGSTISSTCRKPFFSRPMSTNAASRPTSTLSTTPL